MGSEAANRDTICVIVPFRGEPATVDRLLGDLRAIDRGPRDELIVVDNSPRPVISAQPDVTVLRAGELASSYYARNVGARAANADWLLFTDADCRPAPDLLTAYRSALRGELAAVVGGDVVPAAQQSSLVARWHRSRQHLRAFTQATIGPYASAGTANLLVRKELWLELDGFCEVTSGADFEFCWRAGRAGSILAYAPAARVEHLHPEDLATVLRNARRYGAGQHWANTRFPGARPAPPIVAQLARAVAGTLAWLLILRFERAAFKAIDGIALAGYAWGYRFDSNRPTARSPE